ncbi:MAG: phosphatase PAP2 family protein [Flavobacteriales bacterium]|nr:phosphatase PAP2 family protein [Flavobacteriales bacterium]
MSRGRSVLLFLMVALVFAVPALIATLLTDQLELHSAINRHHADLADLFFRFITHWADGLVPTVLALLFLFFGTLRSFMMIGLSCGLSAIVAQLLKRQVFDHVDRPFMFREQLSDMHWVQGIEMHHHFSFPSGHSTAAFSMCLALAVIWARPRLAVVLSIAASLMAFSRVYLSQHFTEDILAGAALGTVTALLVYRWLYDSMFSKRAFLERRVGFNRAG